jgi:hypothetical protein
MLKHLALFVAIFAAGPASALSCLRPEVGSSVDWADEREEAFVLALGSLARSGPNVMDGPETGDPNMRVGYGFPAKFSGRLATSEGFVTERELDVTVEVDCVSAWCGWDSESDYGLYFLRLDAAGTYALEAGPCGGFFFDDPEEHQLMELIGRMP